jgi:hypothetical protein
MRTLTLMTLPNDGFITSANSQGGKRRAPRYAPHPPLGCIPCNYLGSQQTTTQLATETNLFTRCRLPHLVSNRTSPTICITDAPGGVLITTRRFPGGRPPQRPAAYKFAAPQSRACSCECRCTSMGRRKPLSEGQRYRSTAAAAATAAAAHKRDIATEDNYQNSRAREHPWEILCTCKKVCQHSAAAAAAIIVTEPSVDLLLSEVVNSRA